ncbi:MAG: hypothetical protein LBF84_03400 [Holosporales bacterium]|jgi:malonyl CoA-acyl carrier protein transacylase|nr:hypothetical protein [Holosporales bacterium]
MHIAKTSLAFFSLLVFSSGGPWLQADSQQAPDIHDGTRRQDKPPKRKIALFFPGLSGTVLESMSPLIFEEYNQKVLLMYPKQIVDVYSVASANVNVNDENDNGYRDGNPGRNKNQSIETRQNCLNLRSISIFRALKKNKVPFDIVYAQSCGLFPALYATKALSLKDEVDFSQKRARIIQNVCDEVKTRLGRIDLLIVHSQDADIRFEINASRGVYLVARHAYDTRCYICLVKPLREFIKVIPDFHFVVLKDQAPLYCSLMFPAVDEIDKALRKKKPRSPKAILISDASGKEILNKADVQNVARMQIISAINTVKACKTLNKHEVTDVIIIGGDEEKKQILEKNLFGVRIYMVATKEDIQHLLAKMQASR